LGKVDFKAAGSEKYFGDVWENVTSKAEKKIKMDI
jgi:hypothetical protein